MNTRPFVHLEIISTGDVATDLDRRSTEYRVRIQRGLDAAGLGVQNTARRSIMDGPKTGRIYRISKTVEHRASAPGEAPANRTGRLVASIVYQVDRQQLHVDITAGTEYARHLEFGTRKMAARPFLIPAIRNNLDRIRLIIRTYLSTPIGGS